jgi:hypothetical protein
MKPNQPAGFRLHLRHLAILVVFFSIFLGLLVPVSRDLGAKGVLNPTLLLLLAAPWLLGVLILVLERKSPVKFWLAPFLLSLLAPALAIAQNWMLVEYWMRTRTIPNLLGTLFINAVSIGSFTFVATEMCPRRCPECKRLAMIPLRNLWGAGARTPNTRWCASCGAKYWRTCDGEWREERRHTWLDNVKESTKVDVKDTTNPERSFKPEERVVAPILSNTRIMDLATQPEGARSAETEVEVSR